MCNAARLARVHPSSMSQELRRALILPALLAAASPAAATAASGTAPLAALPRRDEAPSIGPYRLLGELGSGGMGTVFLAEQTEPVPRRVALKVIRPDRVSPRTLALFDIERRALAATDHEHVARLYDVGTTGDGRPWLAMELVAGEPLLEYCDRRRLDVKQRLQLFAT